MIVLWQEASRAVSSRITLPHMSAMSSGGPHTAISGKLDDGASSIGTTIELANALKHFL